MKVPKNSQNRHSHHCRKAGLRFRNQGMTLLEMTVVIMVLITLISVLFFATRSWKRGSDRAICLINIQAVQKAVRSYSNLYGYYPGGTAPNLQTQIIGLGKFIEATPACPAAGSYSYGPTYGPDTVPPIGELYMECSLSTTEDHVPALTGDW